MVSLTVSRDVLTISFSNKVVALKRHGAESFEEERLLPIEAAKSDQGTTVTHTTVTDGSVPVVCSSVSASGRYFVACTNKTLSLWELPSWSLLGSAPLSRAASSIAISNSEDKIVVADKSGDAYLYQINQFSPDSTLLLGHVSMLLKVAISPDDKYVITCDRDEKVRVSHFPNAYNIQTFCLGHTDCVTCLDFPTWMPNTLISGSSDGTVRLWNYTAGNQLCNYDCTIGENRSIIVDLISYPIDSTQFYICVIMNNYNYVRLLSVDHSNSSLKCTFQEDVVIPCSAPRALASSGNELFVLSHDSPNFISSLRFQGQSLFAWTEMNEKLKDVTRKFNEDFLSIKDHFNDERLFSYFNKRKIDDTQDYYKRKNERLQGNRVK